MQRTSATDPAPLPRGIVTIMFTDIVDSSRLKQVVDGQTSVRRDTKYATDIKQPHDELVVTFATQANALLINQTGDGYCFAFEDIEEAVLCAVQAPPSTRCGGRRSYLKPDRPGKVLSRR